MTTTSMTLLLTPTLESCMKAALFSCITGSVNTLIIGDSQKELKKKNISLHQYELEDLQSAMCLKFGKEEERYTIFHISEQCKKYAIHLLDSDVYMEAAPLIVDFYKAHVQKKTTLAWYTFIRIYFMYFKSTTHIRTKEKYRWA